MSTFFAFLGLFAIIAAPVALIVLIIKAIAKKPTKKTLIVWLSLFLSGVLFFILSYVTDPASRCEHKYEVVEEKAATCENNGEIVYHCDLCNSTKTETIKATGHKMATISKIEPSKNSEGKIISKCEVCGFEKTEILERLTEAKTKATKAPKTEPTTDITQPSASFEEIYNEYELNEVRADEKYKGNRYTVTAKVNGINNGGGLLNFDDDINLTMEKKVGNTIVFFYASFDKSQKDSLMNINVGDEITFEGTCYSAGSWDDCVLK